VSTFGIAGLQLHVSGRESNLTYLEARVNQVMSLFPWVEMVLFSELAAFGPSLARAETLPGAAEDSFREMAKKHDLWVVNGSLYEKRGKDVYNTASVIDPSGKVVARHRKLFPFRPYEKDVKAGSEFVVFDVPEVGRFGVSICYDGWFPETTRTLVGMGAEVILHPSLTGTIDRDVELSIARASAATNQCYFIDINGLGAGGTGQSIVVGPEGDVVHQAGTSEELIPVELDLDRVRRTRERGMHSLGQPLKSFRDREVRFGVYDPRWKGGNEVRYLDTLGPLKKPGRHERTGSSRESGSSD